MAWPGEDDGERPARLWQRIDRLIGRLPPSAYWSDVLKDVGKYILLGAAIAPYFGFDNRVKSAALSGLGLLAAAVILYVGSRIDPDETRKD